VILQTASERIEGVADRDVGVLMCMVIVGLAADHDLTAGNRQIDADGKKLALLLMPVTALHHHPTGSNAVAELVQFFRAAANALPAPARDPCDGT
jgi:hypothetical protein